MNRKRTLLDNCLIAATLLLLLWLPIPLGSNRDWSAGFLVLVSALLCGLFCISKWRAAPVDTPICRQAWPMVALLAVPQLWVALQILLGLSQDVGASVQYLMLGCAYTLLFILIVGLFNTRRRLTLLLSVLVVSGTMQAFYGTLMTLSGIEWLLTSSKDAYLGNATGTYVNRNHLAGYLEMTLACGIGLLLALRDGRPFRWRYILELLEGPKTRLRLALVIMVIALVMTHSRMGNAAFFASLMIVGALFTLINREHRLRNSLIITSLVLIDVLVISQYFGLEKLKDRLLETQFEDQVVDGEVVASANEQRDDIMGYALPLLQKHPVTGIGAGAFESSFQRYPGPDIRLHFDHAHNDYLQFAIEFGLIGLLPLALFVALAFYQALRALWRSQSWYRSGVGFGAAMGLLALMIHSATDFNLQIPANAATFVVMAAVAVLANHHRKPSRRRRRQGSEVVAT
ncbi:O-antigen ligase family protein [Marinobacterium rhizophilum]|uniref:O-antigen ligase family protein n=1 Tax=Marinobacterium rhizophilum TaxID=420402 RepID=UPI00036BCC78|nr:O-antigen ligase family protein [Marinobacterium rhizophilum]